LEIKSFLESLIKETPAILGHIEEVKVRVIEHLNPILKKKSKLSESTLLVSERSEKIEIKVKKDSLLQV
jgi:hypothetical protein